MKSASWEQISARWSSFPLPSYPEIKLEFFAYRRLAQIMSDFHPDLIHIATEGPLGWAARRLCLRRNLPFTTAYHTRFPEYLAARTPRFFGSFARIAAFAALRHFHAPSSAVMVATASIERELKAQKFQRLVRWSRGVDATLFRPYDKALPAFAHLPRPILLYVGRVSVEKNLRAFLDISTPGSKVIVGDGPDLVVLKQEYPTVNFLGVLSGEKSRSALCRRRLVCVPLHHRHIRSCASGSLFRRPACRRHARAGALRHIRGRRLPGFCRHGSGFRPCRCSSPAIAR